jgi:two-component system, OmpR family, alkaline phosphatase synthesis response regulator PhoP
MKKILVIGENDEIISKIQETLDSSRFEIYSSKNSESGVSLAKDISPNIILCQYPYSLTSKDCVISVLRVAKETSSTPILLLMRQIEPSDIRYGFGLGADDYLVYPFNAQELFSVINFQINRYEQHMYQVNIERRKNLQLQRDLDISLQKLNEVRQFNLIKSNLIGKISTDLRDPMSNINMAIRMLLQCHDDDEKIRYLTILESECAREIKILNEVDTLHSILTLDNMEVLNRFSLLSV